MDKSEIRAKYKEIRDDLEDDVRHVKSVRTARRVSNSNVYKNADVVLSYLSIGTEANTLHLIGNAVFMDKTIGVPHIIDNGEMVFIKVDLKFGNIVKLTNNIKETMQLNKYGIYEPEFDESKIIKCTDKTICLVPFLAFDEKLNRVGYGGGYYDRFMAANPQALYIGFGFEKQLCKEGLPTEEFDVPLDVIVTEKKARLGDRVLAMGKF